MPRHRSLAMVVGYLSLAGLVLIPLLGRPSATEEGSAYLPADDSVLPETIDQYGLDVESYHVVDGRTERNQTWSEILSDHGVAYPLIAQVASHRSETFDPRRLQINKNYRVYTTRDTLASPHFLVYESGRSTYSVLDLRDSVRIYTEHWPETLEQRTVEGTISSSLYQTLVDMNIDPVLAFDLSEVFAWQIDFYRIRPGDSFKVIYDERRVRDEKVGVGLIHAAQFVHQSNDFFAFHFPAEGEVSYFDEDGNSLRKAFLMAPVKYSRISSRYSKSRFHPVLKRYRSHLGTDYAAAPGTPIRATGDGVVVEATYKKFNGRYVKIRHNGTYTTAYLHMSRIARGIEPGAKVKQGDVIGNVGSTGLATGPHVCYRFWKTGKQVDPLRESFPSAKPVSEANRQHFFDTRDQMLDRLLERTPVSPPFAMLP